ncbi:hypothetical protein SEA_EVANESCE_50 [Mycobacterium phage Evanesce]|uniref:DNA binding protein n=12 Tax=Caudoviricetes TaxID=2731619 RepID=A0A8T8JBL1_9CAUD|nr:hypothetical protein Giles_49 [Mycobacterium phage Giles]AHY84235.1 hypothetical protein PBI_HH92_50 [Mycobacterium phage HH92]AKQ07827.1 hypothetical protein SEA_KINBOTE_51 [Mycobacterium phage Kinbote]ALF00271.1 hypothetical protein SEA_EVANESCE_50 [Mycobacterium phage Evanesce]ATN90424.1 Zn-finger DNA binding domain protein [Mycobacterium phage LilHazelnut]QDH48791.1 hypothetical protein SEA_DEEPSOIL15_51 [Mycobacterium phage DeepSoil15]QIQ62670.1 hypothetical protein SEA_EIN37_51 [Myco
MTSIDPNTPCAACGCVYADHCGVCGCRTNAGTRDECLCAKFVAVIHTCTDCGTMFGRRWQLQNHRMPVPTCKVSARAAAGAYADRPSFAPPLKAHRDKYLAGAR